MDLFEEFNRACQSKCGIGYNEEEWTEIVNSKGFFVGFRKGWFARVDRHEEPRSLIDRLQYPGD